MPIGMHLGCCYLKTCGYRLVRHGLQGPTLCRHLGCSAGHRQSICYSKRTSSRNRHSYCIRLGKPGFLHPLRGLGVLSTGPNARQGASISRTVS